MNGAYYRGAAALDARAGAWSMVSRDSAFELSPYFGLPKDVAFCNKCVISNQRPNSAVEYQHKKESLKETISFDKSGTCDACNANDAKTLVDWASREAELLVLCDRHRKKNGEF